MRGLLVIAGLLALPGAARAEPTDYSAGKTPAQLFSGDCAACHQSPRGLAKGKDQRSLAEFLREHYTTKAEIAGVIATYLLSNPGPAPEPRGRQRSTPASAPVAAPEPKPADDDPLFRRIFGLPTAEPEPDAGSIAAPEPGEAAPNARQKGKPRTAARPGAERPPAEAAKEKAREAREKDKEKEAAKEAAKESAKEAARAKKPDPAEVAKAEAAKVEEAAREAAAKEAAAKAEAAKAEAARKVRAYVNGGEAAAPAPDKPPG
jgi:hypothetical protein